MYAIGIGFLSASQIKAEVFFFVYHCMLTNAHSCHAKSIFSCLCPLVMARVEILSRLVENIVGETPSRLVEIVFSVKNETLYRVVVTKEFDMIFCYTPSFTVLPQFLRCGFSREFSSFL